MLKSSKNKLIGINWQQNSWRQSTSDDILWFSKVKRWRFVAKIVTKIATKYCNGPKRDNNALR